MRGPGTIFCGFADAGFLRELGAARMSAEPERPGKTTAADVCIVGAPLFLWGHGCAQPHELLRFFVYDGEFDAGHARRPSQQNEHQHLGDAEGIRLRLGTLIDRKGGVQQKGVDTLLVLDMLEMAQHRAYDVALLIAGDRDFAELVDVVQRYGRSVWLGVDERRTGLSRALRQAVDRVIVIEDPDLAKIVRPRSVLQVP